MKTALAELSELSHRVRRLLDLRYPDEQVNQPKLFVVPGAPEAPRDAIRPKKR